MCWQALFGCEIYKKTSLPPNHRILNVRKAEPWIAFFTFHGPGHHVVLGTDVWRVNTVIVVFSVYCILPIDSFAQHCLPSYSYRYLPSFLEHGGNICRLPCLFIARFWQTRFWFHIYDDNDVTNQNTRWRNVMLVPNLILRTTLTITRKTILR